jgi:hypothetical protein
MNPAVFYIPGPLLKSSLARFDGAKAVSIDMLSFSNEPPAFLFSK